MCRSKLSSKWTLKQIPMIICMHASDRNRPCRIWFVILNAAMWKLVNFVPSSHSVPFLLSAVWISYLSLYSISFSCLRYLLLPLPYETALFTHLIAEFFFSTPLDSYSWTPWHMYFDNLPESHVSLFLNDHYRYHRSWLPSDHETKKRLRSVLQGLQLPDMNYYGVGNTIWDQLVVLMSPEFVP